MATITLNVLTDRYNSLAVAPKAWLLYLPTSDNIKKADTLLVREVDSLGNYLGRYRTGICNKTSTEQFIVYPKGTQCYYFTPLSNPMQIFTSALFKLNVAVSHTGDVLETILFSFKIPAGTMAANDILRITSFFATTGTLGTYAIKYRISTTGVIAGSSIIASNTIAAATDGTVPLVRNITFKNSLSAQSAVTLTAGVVNDEIVAIAPAKIALTDNYANDQYILITGQTLNAADTIALLSCYGLIIR